MGHRSTEKKIGLLRARCTGALSCCPARTKKCLIVCSIWRDSRTSWLDWPLFTPGSNEDYNVWGVMQQRVYRKPAGMSMNSRSDWLKSGLVWSRTLSTLLSTNGECVCVPVFTQRSVDIFENLLYAVEQNKQLDKLSATLTEM